MRCHLLDTLLSMFLHAIADSRDTFDELLLRQRAALPAGHVAAFAFITRCFISCFDTSLPLRRYMPLLRAYCRLLLLHALTRAVDRWRTIAHTPLMPLLLPLPRHASLIFHAYAAAAAIYAAR